MSSPSQPGLRHWRRVRQFSLPLLGVWFLIIWSSIWFVRELAHLTLLGWPVSFYMAAQGSVLAYVAIVGIYAWWMDRLDAPGKVEERGAAESEQKAGGSNGD